MTWTLSTLPGAAAALQSSISALERDIAALESQSSGLEPWLGRFTLLVAIGVALEIFVVIHDHRKEINEWRVSELIPEGPSLIKLGIEIASIILVIAGVVGEFGVGLQISSISGQLRAKGADLRSKSVQLLAFVNKEAGDANERASKNEIEAAQLRKQLQPRTLDEAARKAISDKLLKFVPGLLGRKVTVSSYMGDAEGIVFSLEVLNVLTRSKIDTDPVIGRVQPVGLVDMGIRITGPTADEGFIRSLAANIRSHVDTNICSVWGPKYPSIEVLVAAKDVVGLPRITSQAIDPCSNIKH